MAYFKKRFIANLTGKLLRVPVRERWDERSGKRRPKGRGSTLRRNISRFVQKFTVIIGLERATVRQVPGVVKETLTAHPGLFKYFAEAKRCRLQRLEETAEAKRSELLNKASSGVRRRESPAVERGPQKEASTEEEVNIQYRSIMDRLREVDEEIDSLKKELRVAFRPEVKNILKTRLAEKMRVSFALKKEAEEFK
jgi:hypothetical protein